MKATPLAIADVLLIAPTVHEDDRGHFYESFNARDFAEAVRGDVVFVQDNQARSRRGVVRGLHYQLPPSAQGKLVRVIAGEVFDVAVDMRRSSPTFRRWIGERLSADNRLQLWIPAGFAHGYMALTDGVEVLYKATALYDPRTEAAIRWDDPKLAIGWPDLAAPIVSGKDRAAPSFDGAATFD
jgi:dTDP-4-dehydrorhamnose 3,5-epimerase